jgi:hypothetical protein
LKQKSDLKPIGKQKKEHQTVDLGKLSGQVGAVTEFLREHVKDLKGRVLVKGSQIQVEGVKHKEVKLFLHKFLRHAGLDDHRVLSQSGILEIVPPHVTTHPRHEEGTTPPAAATMPYLFPGTPPPAVAEKKRRKKS